MRGEEENESCKAKGECPNGEREAIGQGGNAPTSLERNGSAPQHSLKQIGSGFKRESAEVTAEVKTMAA